MRNGDTERTAQLFLSRKRLLVVDRNQRTCFKENRCGTQFK